MIERERTSEAGFSLAETLVALFVVALLATSGGALLMTSLQASERVRTSTTAVSELEVMHATLRDDLAAMTRRGSTPADGLGPSAGPMGTDGRADGVVLSFVRGGWARLDPDNELRSDLQRVTYRRQGDTLVRTLVAAPDPSPETRSISRVVATGLTDLRVRYRFEGQWADRWEAANGDPERPLASVIELAMTFANGDTLTQRFLVEPPVS